MRGDGAADGVCYRGRGADSRGCARGPGCCSDARAVFMLRVIWVPEEGLSVHTHAAPAKKILLVLENSNIFFLQQRIIKWSSWLAESFPVNMSRFACHYLHLLCGFKIGSESSKHSCAFTHNLDLRDSHEHIIV